MKRYGSVIGVRPEAVEEYKKRHAKVWPEVLDMIRRCNIRNYSIYLKDDLLFGYFEYHGSDFEADIRRVLGQFDLHLVFGLSYVQSLPASKQHRRENFHFQIADVQRRTRPVENMDKDPV